MNHRKEDHAEKVPICTNYLNGSCEYVTCWFKHSETINEKTNLIENKNLTEKLLNMMEKFVERLAMMENCFKTTQ